MKDVQRVFRGIYARNEWNGIETRSGPGSGPAATARLRQLLLELVAELEVTSVVDAACGEGWWQPDLPGYLGLDVVPEAIEAARRHHPEREYRVHDMRQGVPRASLVLCRDAIQHMSPADGVAALRAIRASGSEWLLASTYVDGLNVPIRTGGFYSPDLEQPPFGLPAALRLYHDGYDYGVAGVLRDRRKMLGLWSLEDL